MWRFGNNDQETQAGENSTSSLNLVQAYKSGQGDHSRLDKYVSTGFLGHEDELVMAVNQSEPEFVYESAGIFQNQLIAMPTATGAHLWETFSGRPVRSPFGADVSCFSSTESNPNASILVAVGKNDGCADLWAPKGIPKGNFLSINTTRP